MTDFFNINAMVNKISSMVNCGACNDCEGESVYLMPWEVDYFKREFDANIATIDDIHYLQRNRSNCQFFDENKNCENCKIYEKRPFCCRLYPLGIFDDNGTAKWGVYKHCCSVKNIPVTFFSIVAEMLERELSYEYCSYLHKEDRVGYLIENLQGAGKFRRGNQRYQTLKDVGVLRPPQKELFGFHKTRLVCHV
ncbi:MAG: YkgJ family cysteine cluster protein [Candidatus Magnetobacterium sp. LHC-1]|uniref:YkgJ family cysteine cluster protein n=1 Tax=Candidatus Magnetobacterium casense TaxID=1455061 RepID=A0ABS6RWB7_9BACT|nr:YkgJ family cysteine cluster protein [Candidatus Magnetobacterium casensis]MBF0606020.1 YkgJ family cysteine cluster protein [Nitrospirota bacterium]MBV6340924.1 YkgJ family cysteine cluster protein [Candidatus Magnetobacterium casensis]